MKTFIISIILGVFLAFGYFYWKNNQSSLPIIKSLNLKPKENFSVEKAPKDSLKGAVQSVSGSVKWQSRTATEPAELKKETLIQQGEDLLTEKDGKLDIKFGDLAEIKIASQSALSIIQTLPANIVFSQNYGAVEYEKLGQTPVSIRSFHLIVIFDGKIKLATDKISGIITIEVEKGSAQAGFNDLQYISKVENLNEGQIWEFNDTKREMTLLSP